MLWQRLRLALCSGAVLAAAGLAHAQDKADRALAVEQGQAQQAAPAPAADCAPQYRTVCVTEWVPEQYQCTRTVYKAECRQETYTAYRCECVPETRTRTCTVYKMVQETKMVARETCTCVPTYEERTVMQTFVTCKPVTKIVKKCEDHGHWECREVPCGPSLSDRIKKCFHRKKDCCECEPCCVKTKTEKVWVPCKVWVEVPVTCYERVCEQRPVTCKVCTYKLVKNVEQVPVTCCKCVPETKTETYTCMVTRKVPYQATRTVTVCVPVQETVTQTRMVCRVVQKQVPVETCCAPKCCCDSCCTPCCGKKHGCRH